MFKRIVVPTDGSPAAARAVETAVEIAAAFSSELVILHVTSTDEVPEALLEMARSEHLIDADSPAPGSADFTDAQTRAATIRGAVGRFIVDHAKASAHAKGVDTVTALIEIGDPATVVVETAKQRDADLVVMGTRGLSELRGLLMGSVSHKVSQLVHTPCMLVK